MQTLKLGSKGADVKTLQSLLNASTQIKVSLKVDGDFGKSTKAAVKLYQTANKLESDGIVGAITWAKLQGTKPSIGKKPVDYKQYDARWGKKLYTVTGNKKQTMAASACGPTAMADVVATFFDTSVTPYTLAQLAVNHKPTFRTRDSGTKWEFFKYIATRYEFSAFKQTSDHAAFLDAISKGALVVCSMGPKFWTKAGHFICAWKYENGYVYANDPASGTRTKQKWTQFQKDRKQYFIFYPPIGWNNPVDDDDDVVVTPPPVEPKPPVEPPVEPPKPYSGPMGIYDISKWQGFVNWAKVKASGKVGLMICRAGFGQSTKDTRFEEYMAGLKKYQIPYAAYWFSYATSVAGAEKEAESFYKIASPHKPLLYVLDAEDRRVDGEFINAFAKKIIELSNGKTGLYVANHLFGEYKSEGMDTKLWDFIWIPKYVKDSPPTHRPCDLWQYGGSYVSGFSGNIDSNKIPAGGRYDIEWYLGLK